MLWREEVSLLSFSSNHIDMEVDEGSVGDRWLVTEFYGNPETSRRAESWSLLQRLGSINDLPWLRLGDFNEIMWSNEKTGQCNRRENQMSMFRAALKSCGLNDLGFNGRWFTWERGRSVETNVRKRLDRCTTNLAWTGKFPEHELNYLAFSTSDHKPILLSSEIDQSATRPRKTKKFHLEATWVKEEGANEIVKDVWENSEVRSVQGKIKEAGISLKTWFGTNFGIMKRMIEVIQNALEEIQNEEVTNEVLLKENELKEELNSLFEREETF
ncbi:hypothetical protein DITRI_Ditri19aG0084600 [Diplodiscus trichospermus]